MSGVEPQIVELPSHFSQVQLTGLKAIVDHHIVDGHSVQFDAKELERIDGAAVQFLLAISMLKLVADSPGAVVINSNEVLTKALIDMGVSDLIQTELNDNATSDASSVDE
ncbi:MAG: hypothetical protein AB8B87_16040 [Granulosicoccus sp.]